jgi:hypothetical protein
MSKKNQPLSSVTPQSEAEAIVVQHALALYRDAKAHAKNAPHGQFLTYAEALTVVRGRELLKTTLQTLVQEEVNDFKKKTKRDSAQCARRKKASRKTKQANRNRHRNHRS